MKCFPTFTGRFSTQVIFFRDQTVTPDQQKEFGGRFGSLNIHPYVKGMTDHPEVMEIIKEPEDRLNFGGGWHSDMSFQEKPALGSILYGLDVPGFGGDTLFASQYAAYDALSDAMKDLLEGLLCGSHGGTGIQRQRVFGPEAGIHGH